MLRRTLFALALLAAAACDFAPTEPAPSAAPAAAAFDGSTPPPPPPPGDSTGRGVGTIGSGT